MQSHAVFVALTSLLLASVSAEGSAIYSVALDTSPLIGHVAGPFSLTFQLNDGSGSGDANNTATLTNFDFGGGAATGLPTLAGGATGLTTSGISITDSDFLNSVTQSFTAGAMLRFRLSLTANPDIGGVPDQFSFAILDSSGAEIPTAGLGAVGTDALLVINISKPIPDVQTFASDAFRSPVAGGSPVEMTAPTAIIPEPAPVLSLGGAFLAACIYSIRRKLQGIRD